MQWARITIRGIIVALLAEGVDRNIHPGAGVRNRIVALLAEGVDRNCSAMWFTSFQWWSPSSRRAWIEISMYGFSGSRGNVALLAEGVDRNGNDTETGARVPSRPPRGGRG